MTVKRVGGNWDNLGGLVGYANNSTTIKNCSNSGDVTGYRYAGGIAGNLSGNSSIINCTNSGNVILRLLLAQPVWRQCGQRLRYYGLRQQRHH